jgi:hypothetical protein
MNEVRVLVANLYFLTAKAARLTAVLVGVCGIAYSLLAVAGEREFAGLSAAQLLMVGILGPLVLFGISVALEATGRFMTGGSAELK